MTPNEYQALAARTLIDKPAREYSVLEIMIVWNAVGLAGEVGELTKLSDNYSNDSKDLVIKEMGDIFWYMSALCTKLEIPFEKVINVKPNELARINFISTANAIASGDILDYVKKGVFHDHGIEPLYLVEKLKELMAVLLGICKSIGIDPQDVITINIAKLKARYPNGFDVEASRNRNEN